MDNRGFLHTADLAAISLLQCPLPRSMFCFPSSVIFSIPPASLPIPRCCELVPLLLSRAVLSSFWLSRGVADADPTSECPRKEPPHDPLGGLPLCIPPSAAPLRRPPASLQRPSRLDPPSVNLPTSPHTVVDMATTGTVDGIDLDNLHYAPQVPYNGTSDQGFNPLEYDVNLWYQVCARHLFPERITLRPQRPQRPQC